MNQISIKTLAALATFVAAFTFSTVTAQNHTSDVSSVQRTIEEFVQAGDQRNSERIDSLPHPFFRVVANQLMGATSDTIIS